MQTSKIIGTKVKTAQGEEVGVVKDVVIDRSTGCMAYTVLSAGGTGTHITARQKSAARLHANVPPKKPQNRASVRSRRKNRNKQLIVRQPSAKRFQTAGAHQAFRRFCFLRSILRSSDSQFTEWVKS